MTAYCKDIGVVHSFCILSWMPHVSVDIGEDAMPTPWSFRASTEDLRLEAREATYTSIGRNLKAMLTIVVETKMSERGLVVSPVNEVSRHHQQIPG